VSSLRQDWECQKQVPIWGAYLNSLWHLESQLICPKGVDRAGPLLYNYLTSEIRPSDLDQGGMRSVVRRKTARNTYTPLRYRAFTYVLLIMTINCPKAQQFYADKCAPLLDKYRNDDRFIVTSSDGVKLFDVQLALLTEHDVFSPVVTCDNKVIGFAVEDHPEYLFADTQGAGSEDSNALDIFLYTMKRFVEDKQKTSVFTYSGFRKLFINDGNVVVDE